MEMNFGKRDVFGRWCGRCGTLGTVGGFSDATDNHKTLILHISFFKLRPLIDTAVAFDNKKTRTNSDGSL